MTGIGSAPSEGNESPGNLAGAARQGRIQIARHDGSKTWRMVIIIDDLPVGHKTAGIDPSDQAIKWVRQQPAFHPHVRGDEGPHVVKLRLRHEGAVRGEAEMKRGPGRPDCGIKPIILCRIAGLVDQNVNANCFGPGCIDPRYEIGDEFAINRRAIGELRNSLLVKRDDNDLIRRGLRHRQRSNANVCKVSFQGFSSGANNCTETMASSAESAATTVIHTPDRVGPFIHSADKEGNSFIHHFPKFRLLEEGRAWRLLAGCSPFRSSMRQVWPVPSRPRGSGANGCCIRAHHP